MTRPFGTTTRVMNMNNKSRKQKGRYLQNLVRDRIFKLFPSLTKEDIRCALMSEPGADVKLTSLTSRKLFPYGVECKNRQVYRGVFNAFKQAKSHGSLEPLLIIKSNRLRPLAIIDMEHFFNLLDE